MNYNVYIIEKEAKIEKINDETLKFSKFKEIKRTPLATCTSENLHALRMVGDDYQKRIIDLDEGTAWIKVIGWETAEEIGVEKSLSHYDQLVISQMEGEVSLNYLRRQHWHFD